MRPTEDTQHMIRALRAARGLNLEKLFASAIDVEILDYTTGASVVERVSVPAEFARPLKDGLMVGLEKALARRLETLNRDVRDVRAILDLEEDAT